jgi:hypothetical protein
MFTAALRSCPVFSVMGIYTNMHNGYNPGPLPCGLMRVYQHPANKWMSPPTNGTYPALQSWTPYETR